jgi:dinuclear metal center YbgI/SA1388 family protein
VHPKGCTFFLVGTGVAARVADLIAALGELAPWELAEEWDNSGLQVGDRDLPVEKVAVALDPGPDEISGALGRGARLLVTHHPLLFHPLRTVDLGEPGGELLASIIRGGLSVVSVHTNLDAAPGGLADLLARRLGLTEVASLAPPHEPAYMKLVVFAPDEAAGAVATAMKEAGAGLIGRYRGCVFASRGTGFFTPLPGASPAMGRVGTEERVAEVRLEARTLRRRAGEVVAAIRRVHPYEEPAIDLNPILGCEAGAGLGRVGNRELSPARLIAEVKRSLKTATVRTVGKPPRRIERVAVLPGSGGDYIGRARAAGADVLVTGEVRYHQALEAAARGPWLLEAGHRVTEAPAVGLLARHLRRCSRERGWNLHIVARHTRGDVFVTR